MNKKSNLNRNRKVAWYPFAAIGYYVCLCILSTLSVHGQSKRVFLEAKGLVSVEAEDYLTQSRHEIRSWIRMDAKDQSGPDPDGDESHHSTASGKAYLEALPDTRRTHDDKLVQGENFSNQPGMMAVLTYPVQFENAGRYYVWVRAFSTGSEDNGIHVGLNGEWPESGQRMQWCEGKQSWRWESKQRTQENHCGEPYKIFLDIPKPGLHEIQFSMREDGFEFDKWFMTLNREFARPSGLGPKAAPSVVADGLAKTDKRPDRGTDGDGAIEISGELKSWHKVTLTLSGPYATEWDSNPNPFVDYGMFVTFRHESGEPVYSVPGYFAADGDSGQTSSNHGNRWRAHLSPDKSGRWDYRIEFRAGAEAALTQGSGRPLKPYHGLEGEFTVESSDKTGRDLRGQGRLQYVGKHHLKFAESGVYFLKVGPDAPETLLGYVDFDGTQTFKTPLKTWAPHLEDWREGDPHWKDGKGKGLIGALNYLSEKGCNVFSFLPYNAGGDGQNVWPFVEMNDPLHYDCSKLDQWQIVFDHAQALGLYLHFKLQEQENDDNRKGHNADAGTVKHALNGGALGVERKLYCREMIARFGHELALNWNLGEENTQSAEEQRAMAGYIRDMDPYNHPIVVHTFPDWQDDVYPTLLGDQSDLTGASLQNSWSQVHQRTLQWVSESARSGKPWVVANDEQNPAGMGVPPDPGYQGHSGKGVEKDKEYDLHNIRKLTLWGNLMAGGAGVEYYFGYQLPQNDLVCEDFRSRERSWEYGRIAVGFFHHQNIPFWRMRNRNDLVGNRSNENTIYCLAAAGEIYLVYLTEGGSISIDLRQAEGDYTVRWFNPRCGGELVKGSVTNLQGGGWVALGKAPSEADEDWLILVRRQ